MGGHLHPPATGPVSSHVYVGPAPFMTRSHSKEVVISDSTHNSTHLLAQTFLCETKVFMPQTFRLVINITKFLKLFFPLGDVLEANQRTTICHYNWGYLQVPFES